jgi:pilus assembly protein Flp/PilA
MDRNFIARLWQDRSVATAIEYAILAAMLSIAAVGAMATLGGSVQTSFLEFNAQFAAAPAGADAAPPAAPPAD